VTEVPEHLLARSRERRAALGLGGDGGGGDEGGAPTPAAAAPAEGAAAPVPVAAAAAPAIIEEPPPPPPPPYVAAIQRTKVPIWVMPVLVALPFWGILYFGAFGTRHTDAAAPPDGAAIYRAQGCSGCHGQTGEGNPAAGFPALHNGEAKLTFPNEADQEQWVRTGSQPFAGKPYGDPNRPGGQHVAKGLMPAFGGRLSDAEIKAVVQYEREQL
jgi:mono/diheme cytochrome c family protein